MQRDICRTRHRNNPESIAAFNGIKHHIAAQEAEVIAVLNLHRTGLTTEQIEEALGLARSSASARVSELKRRGILRAKLIGKTPEGASIYERRRTKSGASAAVIVLAPVL